MGPGDLNACNQELRRLIRRHRASTEVSIKRSANLHALGLCHAAVKAASGA
jgi:hypothetical protein